MNNTYIQNKLKEFDDKFVKTQGLIQEEPIIYCTAPAVENVKEWIEQSLTDYHNHIVEKIDKMLDDLHTENCDEDKSFAFKKKGTAGQVGYEIGIADMKVKIGSLLQDTNTKE